MSRYDVVVLNGRVLLTGYSELADVAIAVRDGRIAAVAEDIPAADADLALLDLETERVATPQLLHSAQEYTPFDGVRIKGWPRLTMLRGKVLYRDGEVIAPAPGEFLKRPLTARRQATAKA